MQLNKNNELKILFIGKENDANSKEAADYVVLHFKHSTIISGNRGDPFPEIAENWKGDLIISYLSQWIIPGSVLKNATVAAVNFHPGPPEYPGIGCTNFAVYNDEKFFGVTCHHMNSRVDTGKIIAVTRFPIFENDSVLSITLRCYASILEMFYQILNQVMLAEPLPQSIEQWKRKPYLRKELNDLCRLTPGMSYEEIERRIRATHYITDWAYFEIGDQIYKLSDHNKTEAENVFK